MSHVLTSPTVWAGGSRELSWPGGAVIYDGSADHQKLFSANFYVNEQPMVVIAFGFPPNAGARCGTACLEHVWGSNDGTDFVPVRLPPSEQPLHLCCAQNTLVIPVSGRYRFNLESVPENIRRQVKLVHRPTVPLMDFSRLMVHPGPCDTYCGCPKA